MHEYGSVTQWGGAVRVCYRSVSVVASIIDFGYYPAMRGSQQSVALTESSGHASLSMIQVFRLAAVSLRLSSLQRLFLDRLIPVSGAAVKFRV